MAYWVVDLRIYKGIQRVSFVRIVHHFAVLTSALEVVSWQRCASCFKCLEWGDLWRLIIVRILVYHRRGVLLVGALSNSRLVASKLLDLIWMLCGVSFLKAYPLITSGVAGLELFCSACFGGHVGTSRFVSRVSVAGEIWKQ